MGIPSTDFKPSQEASAPNTKRVTFNETFNSQLEMALGRGKGGGACCDLCLFLVALFLPPLAVLIKAGCGSDFCINLILTLLLWVPGVCHAWIVILKKDPTPPPSINIFHV